jgi:WD40 repeat protein
MADDIGRTAATTSAQTSRRYAAFISYSHRDEEFGDWLHKRLENYQVPSVLVGRESSVGPIGKRLGKVFRDRADLSAAHDLGHEIREGLEQSDALIVLCSPRSCGSKYVQEEIRTFKLLGKGQRIFAAIIDGEPHAAGRPGYTAADECFPPSLIYALGRDGEISSQLEPSEPIAADFREGKDGRENGSLKIIAGLLDVGLDELVQREKQAERRRQLRANIIAGAMALLAIGATVGGGLAWIKQEEAIANLERAKAGEALAERNEGIANTQRNLANEQRGIAISQAERARTQEIIALANAQEASDQRDRAIAALARTYAERSWAATDAGDYDLAARYALAGWRTAPANEQAYRAALAHVLQFASTFAPSTHASTEINQGNIAVSPDGTLRATADDIVTIARTNQQPETTLPTRGAHLVNFSHDNRLLLTAGAGNVSVWDIGTQRQVARFEDRNLGEISRAAFCGREGLVLITDQGNSTVIWNSRLNRVNAVISGQYPSDTYVFNYHGEMDPSELTRADCSPDGARVVTGSILGLMWVWSTSDGRKLDILRGQAGEAYPRFDDTGTRVLVDLYDHPEPARGAMYNVTNGREVTLLRGHRGPIIGASFTSDNARVITYSQDGTARQWNATSGAQIVEYDHGAPITAATLSVDESRVLTAGGTYLIEWDVRTGRELNRYESPGGITDVYYSNDQRFIEFYGDDSSNTLDIQSGRTLNSYVRTTRHNPVQARWHRNGEIVAHSRDGRYRVRELAGIVSIILNDGDIRESNDQTVMSLVFNDVTSADFSPDGTRLITAGRSGVRVWDVSSGREIALFDPRLPNQGLTDLAAVFSSDGANAVIIGASSNDAAVWGVESLTAPMAALAVHACTRLLEPAARHFRRDEIALDPLISEVWLRGQAVQRDVCSAS